MGQFGKFKLWILDTLKDFLKIGMIVVLFWKGPLFLKDTIWIFFQIIWYCNSFLWLP